MPHVDDLSRSLTAFDQDSTLVAVIEMSLKSWLVAGIVPGVIRAPLKKLGADENAVLRLLHRWREEATKAGRRITRVVVAFEAGRDGFWLARWLRARGIETYVIHAASVAVSREHRWAKTDRLDTEMLKRAVLGWLRGNRSIVIWRLFRRCRKRMRGARTVSAIVLCRADPDRQPDESALVRLGIRGFNPKLRKAAERLEELVTPEGEALPLNTLAESRRDLARLALLRSRSRRSRRRAWTAGTCSQGGAARHGSPHCAGRRGRDGGHAGA